jgi:hypothetical protein
VSKKLIIGFGCLLMLTMSISAQKGANFPTTKMWTEMFKGGSAGAPGNVLTAIGKGFIFRKAVLDVVIPLGGDTYQTTYIGGELVINSTRDDTDIFVNNKLKDTDITATNISTYDSTTGQLDFSLTFSGDFDNAPYHYEVEVNYSGIPEMVLDGKGNVVFQRGSEFSYAIVITPLTP